MANLNAFGTSRRIPRHMRDPRMYIIFCLQAHLLRGATLRLGERGEALLRPVLAKLDWLTHELEDIRTVVVRVMYRRQMERDKFVVRFARLLNSNRLSDTRFGWLFNRRSVQRVIGAQLDECNVGMGLFVSTLGAHIAARATDLGLIQMDGPVILVRKPRRRNGHA